MHAKAIDLLKIFGLEGLAETEAANLPYGAQRKLEIARALATGMKLLLLDEPAAGMNRRRPRICSTASTPSATASASPSC